MSHTFVAFFSALDLLKARLFKKRIPLVIGWCITKRCNYKCRYCAVWKDVYPELNTEKVFCIIDEMAKMGVRKVSFTGGEPLLRNDIGEIIDYAYNKKISVGLNSNGSFVKKRITEIKNLEHLSLSLEGPEAIHDLLRQKGSFRDVMEAARIAAENNIKINFNTTITTLNFNCVDYLLNLTDTLRARIVFQPSTRKILGSDENNPVSPLVQDYSKTIRTIIKYKRGRYKKIIRNSLAGLRHLLYWPDLKKISCAGGIITCRIEPDGRVFHCSRFRGAVKTPLNCSETGFKEAFYGLPPISCNECCCALQVEINHILALNISTLFNAFTCER